MRPVPRSNPSDHKGRKFARVERSPDLFYSSFGRGGATTLVYINLKKFEPTAGAYSSRFMVQ